MYLFTFQVNEQLEPGEIILSEDETTENNIKKSDNDKVRLVINKKQNL